MNVFDRRRLLNGMACVGASAWLRPGSAAAAQGRGDAAPAFAFDEQVTRALAAARFTNRRFPGMVAAIIRQDRLIGLAAEGVRKLGSPERVEVTDRFHLGSNTKAMTATMIGTLIDAGRLRWDSTLAGVFPDMAATMHPEYRQVTLDLLLEHRAGVPANVNWEEEFHGIAPTFQRRAILGRELRQAPQSRPGSRYEYSNLGYALAGLMAEEVTATPWETLMQRTVFGPLGMTTVGFGPPGSARSVTQPWGHRPLGPVLIPDRGDNPPVMGPAGRVSLSVGDWARFAAFHLGNGTVAGRRLLIPETFAELHTPAPGQNYAGGWLISNRGRGGNPVWEHAGSNTLWYAIIRLFPRQKFGVLTACNAGVPTGEAACTEVANALQTLEPITRR